MNEGTPQPAGVLALPRTAPPQHRGSTIASGAGDEDQQTIICHVKLCSCEERASLAPAGSVWHSARNDASADSTWN